MLLNRLLDAQPAARARLSPFAGATIELRAPPFPSLRLAILPGGRLEAADSPPDVLVWLPPDVLTAALEGEEHFLRAVRVEGDARLASELMALTRELRWDPEEELSRVVGDVAAHRLAGFARNLAAWPAHAARRLAENAADYAAEERRVLVKRGDADAFALQVAQLRDAVERLEKRVRALE